MQNKIVRKFVHLGSKKQIKLEHYWFPFLQVIYLIILSSVGGAVAANLFCLSMFPCHPFPSETEEVSRKKYKIKTKQHYFSKKEGREGVTDRQVEAAVLELSILLTQSTFLAKTMDTTICAWAFLQEKLPSQLGSIKARVQTRAPSQT